jgi:biopolymer transport protein ExbB
MKRIAIALIAAAVLAALPARAQDVREASRRATEEREAALSRAREAEAAILADRAKLRASVDSLEVLWKSLEREVQSLERRSVERENRRQALADEWARREIEFKEISGNVIVAARDLHAYLEQSPLTGLAPARLDRIEPLLAPGHFPSIDDIAGLAGLYFDEIERSGQVALAESDFVGRGGDDRRGGVLTIGRFTAFYRDGAETGFLTYSPESRRFFALSERPSRLARRMLDRYFDGVSAVAPFDMSGGAALRQLTRKQTLAEHLRAGGPIVAPIIALGVAAIVIVLRKVRFLDQVRRNTGKYMTRVNLLASEGEWEECEAIVKRHKGEHSPVNHVIEAGLAARHEDRETLESILQEAILRELPRLERGLSPLAIFGAVAPLLGLLGTVTGMIETFNVITVFGTGDPKLMSSGISEALVTTEIGLITAIPIMLLHTFLSRRVDAILGEMEEKAVSLTNIIEKERKRNGAVR